MIINYYIWGMQRSSHLSEKMFDEKIKLMENVSQYMIEYDNLRRDIFTFSLAVKTEMQNNKSINPTTRFKSSTC